MNKMKKTISLSLILIAIIMISVSSISATDLNDNLENNAALVGSHSDFSNTSNTALIESNSDKNNANSIISYSDTKNANSIISYSDSNNTALIESNSDTKNANSITSYSDSNNSALIASNSDKNNANSIISYSDTSNSSSITIHKDTKTEALLTIYNDSSNTALIESNSDINNANSIISNSDTMKANSLESYSKNSKSALLKSYGGFADTASFGDLSYDDFYSSDDASTPDTSDSQSSVVSGSAHYDDLAVIQNSNSKNDVHNVKEMIDLDSLIDSTKFEINQTSENTYILKLADNSTMTVGVFPVYDYNSFKNISNAITNTKNISYDAIVLDFKENLNLKFEAWSDNLIKLDHLKNLIIRGYGATISVNGKKNDEHHFLNVNSDATVMMNNITISGFNTAVINYGICQFTNVSFSNNKVDYMIEEDYGGAIRNWGILKCIESSFTGNSAKYGGAIYNEKGSQSTFIDCFFKDNEAYNCGKGALSSHDRQNIYTLKGASCLVVNHDDKIEYVNIYSAKDYDNFRNMMDKIGHVKFLILNFTSAITCNVNQNPISLPNVENLYIMGNGATINVKNSADSNEYTFLKIYQGQFCSIDNLNINRFNMAIINQGSLSISNSHFNNNRVNYKVKDDYGGSIYNDEGLITISGTTFENGYAKHGASIYNEKGIISCTDSNFLHNKAYGNGGAIYNNIGILYCMGCNFIDNAAENGGAIFNHYGLLSLANNIFNKSVAEDDGGAIYNDFGQVILGNCTFIDSKADKGLELFNYGEDASYSVVSELHVIRNGVMSTIDTTSDKPSLALRIVLRVSEIALCFAWVAISGYFFAPAAAGAISFIGGALLAGAEELIEGVYLDHNFNFFNCLIMMAIAGAFDYVGGSLSSYVGRTCFKVGTRELTGLTKFAYTCVSVGIEGTSELLTEFLPRIDVTNNEMPTTIIDLEHPQIP